MTSDLAHPLLVCPPCHPPHWGGHQRQQHRRQQRPRTDWVQLLCSIQARGGQSWPRGAPVLQCTLCRETVNSQWKIQPEELRFCLFLLCSSLWKSSGMNGKAKLHKYPTCSSTGCDIWRYLDQISQTSQICKDLLLFSDICDSKSSPEAIFHSVPFNKLNDNLKNNSD